MIGLSRIAVPSVSAALELWRRRINTANHFMPIYKFYQDVLCTSWERRHFTVKAQNQEDGEIKLPGKEVYHV